MRRAKLLVARSFVRGEFPAGAGAATGSAAATSDGMVAGKLMWIPSNPAGAWPPSRWRWEPPQSPPWATYRVYPMRFMSTSQARAMRSGSQPVLGWLAGEAVTRHRRDHDVERVLRVPPYAVGIGQRLDDLDLLEHRARPAVRDDHRQGVLVRRADMDEVNVHPVDLGDELRQGFSFASHLRQSYSVAQ